MFTEDERHALISMGRTESKDSTYVLKSIEFLYKNEMDKLPNRTAVKNTSVKRRITPKKRQIISALMAFRMNKYKDAMGVTELANRSSEKKLNLLIQNAIQNLIRPKKQAKFIEEEIEVEIEEEIGEYQIH